MWWNIAKRPAQGSRRFGFADGGFVRRVGSAKPSVQHVPIDVRLAAGSLVWDCPNDQPLKTGVAIRRQPAQASFVGGLFVFGEFR